MTDMVQMEHCYVRPKDFKSGSGTCNLDEMLADRWRMALATDDGFVFARRYIAPTPEEDAQRAKDAVATMEAIKAAHVRPVFAPGDVVRLKSGSPSMTICEIKDDRAFCTWFDDEHTSHGSFPLVALAVG